MTADAAAGRGRGRDALVLEAGDARVVVRPADGGRIGSVIVGRSRAPRDGRVRRPDDMGQLPDGAMGRPDP